MRLARRLVVLAFALIQLILVTRIPVDLGVIPGTGSVADVVVPLSDALAAPVAGLGGGLGSLFGVGAVPGIGPIAGDGLDPVILGALAGWTMVEGLVLRVVAQFATV